MIATRIRLASLDCLRGFAILGILLINIRAFGQVSTAYVNPTIAGSFEGADFWIWFATHVLAEYKFISMLAALFGAGMLIQFERLAAMGQDPSHIHRRRMLSLAAIGFLHITLLWYGDILLLYAVVGLIAFRFRDHSPKRLFGLALLFYLVPLLFGLLMGAFLHYIPEEEYREFVTTTWSADARMVVTEMEVYRSSSWWAQFNHRLNTLVEGYISAVLTEEGWRVLAMMLAGMALYRAGFFTGEWPLPPYWRLLILGLGIGIPLSLFGVLYNLSHDWEMRKSLYLGRQFNLWAGPLVSLAWASLVMIIVRQARLPWLMEPLGALGRMALTGYLLTSIIGTGLFYGIGLGLFGSVDRAGQMLIVVGIWLFLLVLAPLWLRFFQYGPVEWLWRWATYGDRPRLRRT
jgi:uncharacterized protein